MARGIKHYEVYINIVDEILQFHRAGWEPKPDYLVKNFKNTEDPSANQHFIINTIEGEEIYILKSTVSKMVVKPVYMDNESDK